jgi:hypothetical protein
VDQLVGNATLVDVVGNWSLSQTGFISQDNALYSTGGGQILVNQAFTSGTINFRVAVQSGVIATFATTNGTTSLVYSNGAYTFI